MNLITRELRAVRESVRFFTRIPMGTAANWDPADLQRGLTYFPLVGWLVGGVAALSWWLAVKLWPPGLASGISLVVTLLLTGAFHEDGFADVCDGFGGGRTKERVLAIMIDSRVGAYGAIGVAMILLFKWQSVAALPLSIVPWALWCGHSLSRGAACVVQSLLPYVREAENKSRTIAQPLGAARFSVALILAIMPLALAPDPRFWWTIASVALAQALLTIWFKRRIGGCTGDCLGAAQQGCEIVFYLTLLAIVLRR